MEQKNFKRTTVTAALPYANGGVHIGHLAGVYVPADIYVRYLRLKKQDVVLGKNNKSDVAEESRFAYKDIDVVMENQKDLVEPVKKLFTVGVVKG